MKIEIWSDFVCPYCYIGKRHLEKALEQVSLDETVEIEYKSYQLNPAANKHYDKHIDVLIAEKYGISVEDAARNNQRIIASAKGLGLEYNFDTLKPTNTFDAHRLSHYAKDSGKMVDFTEVIMKNYFTDSYNISDEAILLTAAEKVGLDSEEAKQVLNSDQYASEVASDIEQARKLGISGVPFFVINDKVGISGAQPVDTFIDAINQQKQ